MNTRAPGPPMAAGLTGRGGDPAQRAFLLLRTVFTVAEDRREVEHRLEAVGTVEVGVDEAGEVMRRLAAVGVDMDDVELTLEDHRVAGFHRSDQQVLAALAAKAHQLRAR